MSRDGKTTLDWGDGTYTFRLGIGQLEEHDEKIAEGRPVGYPSGPLAVLSRLWEGTWKVEDVRQTIRLGLIGGGKTPAEALKLTRRYVDEEPLLPNVGLAVLILSEALGIERKGPEEGKPDPAQTKGRRRRTSASTSRDSSAPGS
jgi:hypothetical protein